MDESKWQEIKRTFELAVDLPTGERTAFLADCDPELRSEVEKLLSADDEADDFIAEPAFVAEGFKEENPADQYIGRQIDSYKIIKEVGRGGMGTVYLATHADESFDKTVAVKLIKRGMDTNAVLKRFVMERQILARLEHPNIAGLLDGGSTEDGLPYLVMEYFEGEPITKFSDSHALGVEERLELFCKVCDAISYAHQNLVVHRDIKPSNILVTADGIPKLLDFGIAKLLHPDWSLETAEATATMFRIMTPEYASPEQVRGLPITTASDVYSLGVVLYELLSGERPYKIDSRLPDEAAQIVLTAEPVRPSSVVSSRSLPDKSTNENSAQRTHGVQNPRSLRGDLDNIVLKALQKEPSRRYASVHEFSEDIRRHIDGLPVKATADSSFYRLGKFVKRHRAGVLAAGMIALTLLIATTITTWQAVIARRERDKAERRFNQVRKLANTVLFEYHDGIAKLAGSTPLREKMVRDALEYLDNLASENIDDISLQSELASAFFKVGEVQGSPSKSSLGDYGGGLESFRKSLAIREQLFKQDPTNEQFKLDLSRSYQMVGHLSEVTDDIPGALENYKKAFALFETMPMDKIEVRRDFATLHTRYGHALSASGQSEPAVQNFRQAVAISAELVAGNPDDAELQRDLGVDNILLGDAIEEQGSYEEALATYRTAYSVLTPLVTATNAQSKRDALSAYGRIGDELHKLNRLQEALEVQETCLAADKEVLNNDPLNAQAKRDVQVDYYKAARVLSAIGNMPAAIAYQKKVIEFCENAVTANPKSSESRSDLGVSYFRYGEMLEKTLDLTTALVFYRKATEIEENNSKADPSSTVAQSDLSEDIMRVAQVLEKLNDRADALAEYLRAAQIRETLATNDQETPESRVISARLFEAMGDFYFSQMAAANKAENRQEALRRFNQSVIAWDEIQQKGNLETDDSAKPTEVRKKIAKCQVAIASGK